MIKKEHRGINFEGTNSFMIVTDNPELLFDELKEYCESNLKEEVWYYMNPVRPSKENSRPEYSIEVLINPTGFPMFYKQFSVGNQLNYNLLI